MVKITKNGVLELFLEFLVLDLTSIVVNENTNCDISLCKKYVSWKILVLKSKTKMLFSGQFLHKGGH